MTEQTASPANLVTVDVDDLVTPSMIAAELGVSRQGVSNWIARYGDFPPAIITKERVRLYSRRAVLAWVEMST